MAKILTGKVVSAKMQKTVVVLIERKFAHPMYKKVITRHKKFKARVNDEMKLVEGDTVKIKETRPQSKDTHFLVVEVIKK